MVKGRNWKGCFVRVFVGYVYGFWGIRVVRVMCERWNEFVYCLKSDGIDGFGMGRGCDIGWFGVNRVVRKMKDVVIE